MRIAVEGNIATGKSAALAALGAAFPGVPVVLEPVDSWTDLLECYYACPAEWSFAFALKVLLDFRRAPATCLVERSPQATRHVFAQLNYNDGSMNAHQWDLFKEYHDELAWRPDAIFFIDTPVAECMRRLRRRGRACERDVDEDYLRKVEFQYATMLRYTDTPVVRFDGTLPPDELHAQMADAARELLARPAAPDP